MQKNNCPKLLEHLRMGFKIWTKYRAENSKKKEQQSKEQRSPNFEPQKITAKEARHLKNYTPYPLSYHCPKSI